MGNITIIANNFFESASGVTRDDAAKIVTQSGNKLVQNGDKGVTYDKNKDRKTPTDIRITKVEGPFDGKGKLVTKIVSGNSYVFKATPTRAPTLTELKLLKWAIKFNNNGKNIISGVAALNKLDGDKIKIALQITNDFEKAKVYAFYQKADDGVSVEFKGKDIFHPYIIAKSVHRKGMNEKGTAPHHDMISGDMTDEEIIAINPKTKKWIDIVNKEGFEGIKKLAVEMDDLLTDASTGELEEVNGELYKKFVGRKPGDFSNETLSKAAQEHEHTAIFFNRIKDNIKLQLIDNSNFVYEKKLMPCLLEIHPSGWLNSDELKSIRDKIKNKEASQSDIQKLKKHNNLPEYRIDIPSPSYPDNFTGLGIALNDTWGYDITITSFKKDVQKRTFSAEFDIEIFDHYGLNSDDIDPNIHEGYFTSATLEGFFCWFVLQHKCGYKPFLTILKMKYKLQDETY